MDSVKNKKKRFIILLVLVGIFLLLAFSLFGCGMDVAQIYRPTRDYGYTLTNYNVDILVDEDKTMHVSESITAKFDSYTNGIYRYLPLSQPIGVPN